MARVENDIGRQRLAYLSMLDKINEGNMALRTYRFRDKKEVMCTICLLKDCHGAYHRGISVKSPRDTSCKLTGMFWALRRALQASKGKLDTYNEDWANNNGVMDRLVKTFGYPIWKAETLVELTPFEKKIFGVKEANNGTASRGSGNYSGGKEESGGVKEVGGGAGSSQAST